MMAAGNPNNWWNNMHMQTPGPLQSSTSLPTVPSSSSSSAHGQHGPNNSSLLSLLLHNQYMHGGGGGSSSSNSSSSSSCSSASSSSSSTSSSSSSSLPFSPLISDHHNPAQSGGPHQDFPQSWSQLLLGGLASEDQEKTLGLITATKLQENINNNSNSNWGFLAGAISPSSSSQYAHNHQMMMQIKQEGAMQQETQHNNNMISNIKSSLLLYGPSDDGHNIVGHQQQINVNINENMHYQFPHNINITARPRSIAAVAATSALSPQTLQVAASSPKSCVTTLSNNNHNNINSLLDFSTSSFKSRDDHPHRNHKHSSHECNSGTGAASSSGPATAHVSKKPRAQSSSTPPLKVRKEKLGDRITALHQLVSPFGKTDTASVLLEAIGYIRFLQGQIEVLSSPYLNSSSSAKNQSSAHGGERNCLFPDHPGQLLNDSCMKRRAANYQQEFYYKDVGHELSPKDLRSRGLCLVPISFTQLVGGENGADYWGPSLGGGF